MITSRFNCLYAGEEPNARWAVELLDRFGTDEKLRLQVSAARELLSGSARAQMSMQGFIDRPGGILLKPIFAQAMQDQEADRETAVTALEVLDEFISEVDLRRKQLRRVSGGPASATSASSGGGRGRRLNGGI